MAGAVKLSTLRGELCRECPSRERSTAQRRAEDADLAASDPVRVPAAVWLVFRPFPGLPFMCSGFDDPDVARDVAGKRPGWIVLGPVEVRTMPRPSRGAFEPIPP